MRHLVHNTFMENLLHKEKRSHDLAQDTSSTLPRTKKKKMDKRLSSGYGSITSIDDEAVGLYSDNIVEMRPNPETREKRSPEIRRKKKLGRGHSLEGTVDSKDSHKARDRGSWSPKSQIIKKSWLSHHRHQHDDDNNNKQHHHRNNNKQQHHQDNNHIDEGLHSADDLSDDYDDEVEAGFKKRSKSEDRLHMLRRSPPGSNESELCEDFLASQGR